jgi:hypothetical protein
MPCKTSHIKDGVPLPTRIFVKVSNLCKTSHIKDGIPLPTRIFVKVSNLCKTSQLLTLTNILVGKGMPSFM